MNVDMNENDHRIAMEYAVYVVESVTSPSEYRLAKGYIDMVKQRDEANETLVKVADAIQSTHGDDASLVWVADMARLNATMSRGESLKDWDIARMGAGRKG